ncbi:Fic family protein [Algoriphagus resistens]|uniref:hypothetical protein n=1 Tax=Algoriphagus resistens TaxID=1750590 RepID=UPI00071686B3|nr:hypothetical protein [Algoriphagus resistens]
MCSKVDADWFFLISIQETPSKAVNTCFHVKEQMINAKFVCSSSSAIGIVNGLSQEPTVTVEKAVSLTGLRLKTANALVQLMLEKGILREQTGQSRNRFFVFEAN